MFTAQYFGARPFKSSTAMQSPMTIGPITGFQAMEHALLSRIQFPGIIRSDEAGVRPPCPTLVRLSRG
jgi:hypothetical protein